MTHSTATRRRHASACAIAAALLNAGPVAAQTAPDAGSLLQQIEQQRGKPLPPRSEQAFAPPPPMQTLGGATVTVSSFEFAGNTLLRAEQLAPAVAGFLNRPVGFADLQNAAIAVATAYRRAGWVVRVYLPQQDVSSGKVRIQIVEAVFGTVQVQGQASRVSAERLTRVVETAQPPGAPVNGDALDRALLLIDDLPGVSVTGRLSEGRNQAETDLVLSVADGPLLSGDVSIDNAGSRATGAARLSGSLRLNSPLRFGDQAVALLIHTRGSDYLRAAYTLPLGHRGWRVGVNASHLAYQVTTPEFEQLDAKGTASSVGVEAYYPVLRARLHNLYVAVALDDKRFDNQSAAATTTRYKVQVASLGLYGNLFDDLGGGGANNGSLTLVQGRVDLSGSPNEAADAATTRTAGSFHKLRLSASRLQVLTPGLSLSAALSAQMAGKNLDSSEKFYLGGAGGVRAYPASEGGGSSGVLLNLEARMQLPANASLTAFYDWGSVRVNQDNAITGAAVPNRYQLQGIGASIAWASNFGLNLKATLARRIGSNPNATVTGTDQDGSHEKNRLWLQASMPF